MVSAVETKKGSVPASLASSQKSGVKVKIRDGTETQNGQPYIKPVQIWDKYYLSAANNDEENMDL